MEILHAPTFRLNTALFLLFLGLAVYLGTTLPESYPTHFDMAGEPTRWDQGPGMWILLVAVGIISFAQMHLLQRFLLTNPDSTLLNVPHRQAFFQLPREKRVPVFRRMNRMLGLVNSSVLVVFIAILFMTWWGAHQPGGWGARLATWGLWMALGFAVVVPIVDAVAMSRALRRTLEEEGLL